MCVRVCTCVCVCVCEKERERERERERHRERERKIDREAERLAKRVIIGWIVTEKDGEVVTEEINAYNRVMAVTYNTVTVIIGLVRTTSSTVSLSFLLLQTCYFFP